jgi:hypothetical protein
MRGATTYQKKRHAMSDLPYRYRLKIEVEIEADGVQAYGGGTKATSERLADLLESDRRVISVNRWPAIGYLGKAND